MAFGWVLLLCAPLSFPVVGGLVGNQAFPHLRLSLSPLMKNVVWNVKSPMNKLKMLLGLRGLCEVCNHTSD